jgi:HEAT repeat protein
MSNNERAPKVKELIDRLNSPDPSQREEAIRAIARRDLRKVYNEIASAVEDESRVVRVIAAGIMQDSNALSLVKLIEVFTDGLEDTDPRIRIEAARRLSHLADRSADALPTLLSLKRDSNELVRYQLVVAIRKHGISSVAAAQTLKELQADPSELVRNAALRTHV